ncbi:Mpo1-like protein [Roseovarius albus]|uniref:Mpo1-like protein n=1 Tax=Roseovarius albus TaxID=1247867 RepID=UPI00135638F4
MRFRLLGISLLGSGIFGFEKNRPTTFTYPFRSLINEFHMFWDAPTGSLSIKLVAANATYNQPST